MKKLEKIRKALGNVEPKYWNHVQTMAFAKTVEKILGKPKLFAIIHDETFDGDSIFCCPSDRVEFTEGLTILNIKKAFIDKMILEEGGEPLEKGELTTVEVRNISDQVLETYDVKGAWIVDEDTLRILEQIWDATKSGADHQTNHCAKKIVHMLAIKMLGKKPS